MGANEIFFLLRQHITELCLCNGRLSDKHYTWEDEETLSQISNNIGNALDDMSKLITTLEEMWGDK